MRIATRYTTYRIQPFGRDKEDGALPVRSLGAAAQFFAHVFDLTPVERPREDHRVVLQRHNFRLALYSIPGYVPPTSDEPVLVFGTDNDDVTAVRDRVMALDGIVLEDETDDEDAPRLVFTDPDGVNVVECLSW